MSDSYNSKFLDDPEFQSLLVGCLESLQRGETIDRQALAKDFPKYAAEIGKFLQDRQLLEQVASDFGDVEPSRVTISAYEQTIDSRSGKEAFAVGESIRYIGEYEVLEEIARGGMGIVFKARQQKLNRIVALKMILAGRLADKADVERFHREARAAGRLKHVNIVPVHEIGEHERRQYFTMDFVEGQSLAEIIRHETLSPQKAARAVKVMAEAVQYAHQEGIVHRDLKPANVLIDQHKEPHITDFGLARMLESVDEESRAELTATGQILGTPSYMSPEQASGKQALVGPASDIYSLGAILYASLTGRAPFVADSPVDTLLQVMKNDPVSPRDLSPSVPKDLETICLKCLSKEPHKRYGTAQELADDLNRFLEGRPVVARPVGPINKAIRWCRRNRTVATLLCLLFVSMAAGTAISVNYAVEATRLAKNEADQRRIAVEAREEAQEQKGQAELAQREAVLQRDEAKSARTAAEISLARESEARHDAELQRRKAEWQTYLSRMQRIGDVAERNEYGHLNRLLEVMLPKEGEPDIRGWEWYFYRNLVEQKSVSLSPESTFLNLAINPADPSQLVTITKDGIETWNWRTRKRLHRTGPVSSGTQIAFDQIAMSPNGNLVAYGTWAGRLFIVDSKSGEILHAIDAHTEHSEGTAIKGIAWEPETGSRLVTGARAGDLKLWDAATGELERTIIEQQPVQRIQNPAVLRIASLDWHSTAGICTGHRFGRYKVWDPETGAMKWQGRLPNSGPLEHIRWHPSGKSLYQGSIRLWKSEDPEVPRDSKHDPIADHVAWRNDTVQAIGRLHDILLLDIASGETLTTLNVHAGGIKAIAFPDETHLVSLSEDKTIRITEIDSYDSLGAHIDTVGKNIHGIAWSPDDTLVVVAQLETNKLVVYDSQTLSPVVMLKKAEERAYYDDVFHDVCWSHDGKYIAGLDHGGYLTLWNARTREQIKSFKTGTWHYSNMMLSHRGDLLALCGANHGEVYSFPELQRLTELPSRIGSSPVFTSDDSHVIINLAGSVKVFKLPEGEVVDTIPVSEESSGANFCDQKNLFALPGKVVHVFGGDDFTNRATLREHQGTVQHVDFSPEGRRLASGGADGKVRIWDTATFDQVALLSVKEGRKVETVVWSNSGKQIIAGTDDGTLYLFDSNSEQYQRPTGKAKTKGLDAAADGRANSEPLEGTWEVQQMIRAGEKLMGIVEADALAFFSQQTVKLPGFGANAFKYEIESSHSTGTIDFTLEVNDKPQPLRGLYEIKDKTLTMVINEWPDGPRPMQLLPTDEEDLGTPKTHRLYVVLQRTRSSAYSEESKDSSEDKDNK